ncbi:BQ5605_C110g13210 [Microbotryum silenes-dioicae]|uniref:BQ5605_C110g13210 protein n=1 Tax=Microbotryum silenes-dioicae TaxID=796604 RepID=A0A2X0PN73_9BASI|nr:BQ5605_C110g13210 [Microbotryum silenes-dioicae]
MHLRNAGGWSQWIDDVRGALGGDYWNCTLATPVQSPNTRTDLDHANFQAVALLMRSVSPDIRKHIKDGYDHTPAEVLQMIKKAVGTGTVADILIRLQALLDVGPPPTGMDAFAKYQATTIELLTASRTRAYFEQIVSFRLVHSARNLYREYYTQTLRQGSAYRARRRSSSRSTRRRIRRQLPNPSPWWKPNCDSGQVYRASFLPVHHCGGPHWNRKCPDNKAGSKGRRRRLLQRLPPRSSLRLISRRWLTVLCLATSQPRCPPWPGPSIILDSGATHHIVNDRACFTSFPHSASRLRSKASLVKLSTPSKASAPQWFVPSTAASGQLNNALFVPTAPVNLFSASRANIGGYDIRLTRAKATVSIADTASLVDVAALVHQAGAFPCALVAVPMSVLHGRFAHLHPRALRQLILTEAVSGVSMEVDSNEDFEIPHDLLAFDGAVSLGGARYALVIVDDHLGICGRFRCHTSPTPLRAFKSWLAKVERSMSRKVLAVRSDNGGEFMSNEFSRFLEEQGITRQLSIPDTPQQNGVAERANRSITEGVRSMLHQSGLPHALWAEALATYVYVKNRLPHSANSGTTPHTRWYSSKPSAGHLRVFGCRAWKAATTEPRSKLDPRGIPLVFVGYDLESKGYRLLDPNTRQVFKSRSVTFFEDNFPARATGIRAPPLPAAGDDDSRVVIIPPEHVDPPAALRFDAPGPAWQPPAGPRARNPPVRYGALASLRSTPSAFAFSLGDEVVVLVANLAEAGIDVSKVDRPLSKPKDPFTLPTSNPSTWKEAMRHPHAEGWKAGAIKEFRSMKDNFKVFSVVDLAYVPRAATVLPSCHVFRTKHDKAGKMVSLKSRIVAQGCAQRAGDFDKMFAPTAKFTSIRALVAHAASRGHHIIQANVDKAYLHGVLEEEIYMRVPTGIEGYDGVRRGSTSASRPPQATLRAAPWAPLDLSLSLAFACDYTV